MKRVIITALLTLSLAALLSSQASAASYTLKPISAEQSNAFKNKPTVVYRLGKDTQKDVETLEKTLNSYDVLTNQYNSEILDLDSNLTFGTLSRISHARTSTGFGVNFSTLTDRKTPGIRTIDYYTTPTIIKGMISMGDEYDCAKITLHSLYPETCTNGSRFTADMDFDTHIVSVAKLEEEIAKLNEIVKLADTSDKDKEAIAKIIEKAETTLNNQNALQADIDRATSEIKNDLKTLEEDKKKAEEDRKKAEEEKKKQEESANQTEDNKTQQTPQEVAPQSAEVSTKDASTSGLKSPNTGFNQSNSSLALISIFATILLGTTIYRLKK